MNLSKTEGDKSSVIMAREILARLGDKWSVLIIHSADDGPIRFTDLKRRIEQLRPISSRILIRTLKQLERDGLVTRKVFAVVPPRVEYSLTRLGRQFLHFSREILDWTVEYRADFEAARQAFEGKAAALNDLVFRQE